MKVFILVAAAVIIFVALAALEQYLFIRYGWGY